METRQALAEQELNTTRLPTCIGGSYDYAQFDLFVRQRLSIEGAMASAPVVANRISMPGPKDPPDGHGNKTAPQTTSNKKESSSEKTRSPGKNASGKYLSPSEKCSNLQTQVKDLRHRNASLRAEKSRLEAGLAQARLVVSMIEANLSGAAP